MFISSYITAVFINDVGLPLRGVTFFRTFIIYTFVTRGVN